MSMLLMVKAMKARVGNSTRKLVLLKLADNANDEGYCWPSYQHVADQCEISRRSAMRHITELEKGGFLKREQRKGDDGHNRSNGYWLCCNPETLSQKTTMDNTGQHGTLPDDTRQNDSGENLSLGGGDTESPCSDTESPDGDRESLGDGDTVSPRTSHSLESVKESVKEPVPAKHLAFEEFWNAGMRKLDKKKAKAAFLKQLAESKMEPEEFGAMLAKDVQERVKREQFGFSRLHPTTYLNGERWNDELPIYTPDGRYVGGSPESQFEENEDGSLRL